MELEALMIAKARGHDTLYLAKIKRVVDDEDIEPFWFTVITARGNRMTFENLDAYCTRTFEGYGEISYLYPIGPLAAALEKLIGDKQNDDATGTGT
jgi:hypothetical protein